MSNNNEFVTRTAKNQRRKTKETTQKTVTDKILNILIVVVAALIVISLVIIITNDNVKSDITKESKEQSEDSNLSTEPNNQNDSDKDAVTNDEANGEVEEGQSEESSDEEKDLSHISFVESNDSNVIQAWVNANWTPYPTEQTGTHESVFSANHIDYQEKVKLIYRDTEFTEDDSIIWNVKNASGDAVAVLSTLDKSEIYRLTMTWVDGKGWQTTLIEQLKTLEGAY